MDKLSDWALLYDYYGDLLTKQQKKVFEAVFFDDLSLSEVADEEKITRQGVHDMVKRCEKALLDYEDKLGLVKKHRELKIISKNILKLAENSTDKDKLISIAKDLENI